MALRHHAPAARPGGRGERAETLIEVLLTVVLMGIGFTTIFGGLLTVAKVSHANSQRTIASNGIQAWAEGVQQPATALIAANPRASYTYQPCAIPALYGQLDLPAGAIPQSWRNAAVNAKPVKVEYLRGFDATTGEPDFSLSLAECYALPIYNAGSPSVSEDNGLQRITLKVETPPGETPRIVETLVLVKRDQRCPDGFDNADLGPC